MIRPIVKDTLLLQQVAQVATPQDIALGQDLRDTLVAHKDSCVGMAANMIGVNKRVIIVAMGPASLVLYNPVLVSKSGPYETEEGCLSLTGLRKTKRYEEIIVQFYTDSWQEVTMPFSGFTAQVIQHELDHLEGILI